MSPTIYGACKPVVAAALRLLCRYKVENKIGAMPEEPVVVVANHLSWIDIPLVGVCIPRRIAFMAKKEYAKSRFHGALIRLFGSFTVERGTVDRTALRLADEALRKGCALGMFPEGTRSTTLQLKRGGLGAAFIALRNDAFILPVGIAGTEKVRQRYQNKRRFLHRPQVTVNIGQPFKLPRVEESPTRAQLASSTETIMRRLAELLPESYRGVYRDDANTSSERLQDDAD